MLFVLPPRHQNWRISPELRNRDFYLRYYTQTLFLERIGLDKGVQVLISSIFDPQMSCSASESTSFCASASALSSAEACLLRIVFSRKDLVQVTLYCATCAVVMYFACLAQLLGNFSWELQVIHSQSSDVLAAWRCAGKSFSSCHDEPSFDFASWLCEALFCHADATMWLTSGWCRQWPLAYQWTWKQLFRSSKMDNSTRQRDIFLSTLIFSLLSNSDVSDQEF